MLRRRGPQQKGVKHGRVTNSLAASSPGLVARHARGFAPVDMAYPDPAGYAPLREAIAGYLATSRGVHCTALPRGLRLC